MPPVKPEVLEGLKEFDSPTIFNAVVKKLGLPNYDYTDHTIRYLTPEFGSIIGYAVTAEVTTNDADSAAAPWDDYYQALNDTEGPIVAVMKDVDSNPGRGASFGDGMARMHRRLGVVGALVDGTVRDLGGDSPGRVAHVWVGHGTRPWGLQCHAHRCANHGGSAARSTARFAVW